MRSRERVLTAFRFEQPDRPPMWCGASVEFWAKARREQGLADDEALRQRFHDDFRCVGPRWLGPGPLFGIERQGLGYGQAKRHPLAGADLAAIEAYPWPTPEQFDVSNLRAEAEKWHDEYAILCGPWSPFVHDAIDLVGCEEFMLMMATEPEKVDALLRRLVDLYVAVAERTFAAATGRVDIFFFGNDFGSQIGPMFSPAMFERFFVPQLTRLAGVGHDHGLKTMMHCCGGIAPLIPAMIDCGIDALHAVQTTCAGMDLAMLKRQFGRRLVFAGGIDSHHILIEGTPEIVRAETRRVSEIMAPGGGWIGGASHDSILEETPVENIIAMFDTLAESGRPMQAR